MTLKNDQTLIDLLSAFPRPGNLRWIGVRESRRGAMRTPESASLIAEHGIEGDHRARRGGGNRQVTPLQFEHLDVIAALCGLGSVDPAALRRNLAVGGVNVAALVGCRFRIGAVELEGSGPCHPCSRLEEVLGSGAYNAVRGHGGITARVLTSGRIHLGDPVVVDRGRVRP